MNIMNNFYSHALNRKSLWRTLVGLMLVAVLMVGSLPAVQAQEGGAPELFSDAAGAADLALNNPDHVVRSRFVSVNFGVLSAAGNALAPRGNPEVLLNLFADASYTGVVQRVDQNASGSQTWTGSLKETNGYFYLVASEGAFIAHVASQDGIYEVSLAGDNLYKVVQIDQSRLGEDAPGLVDHPDPVLLDPVADPASPIDVMVVYTDDARIGEGSTAAMRARIDLAMAETKQSYINAGVTPRLRLVHAEEVSYAETGFLGTDLNRLLNPSDGILDAVHTWRNLYGADMVTLIVEVGDGCGLAADILASATTAFHVTVRDGCMTGNYSFGHEFGHLQGARHDPYVDPTNTPFAYGHGYVNTADRWRTVMSYNNLCADTSPFTYCTRLQYFSNPGVLYNGGATGVAGTSENFKALNTTANTVANFRQKKIGGAFNTNFTGVVGPWKPVVGTWTIGPTAYRGTGAANVFSSAKVNNIYGDITYLARMKRLGCVSCANSLFIRGNPGKLSSAKWWLPSYQFTYSNDGFISVWRINGNGTFKSLKDWTASAAVVKGGFNTLKVVAVGKSLRFYVNNTLVYAGSDPAFRTGRVGFGFYRDSTSTGNQLIVDWARLKNTPTGGVAYDQLADDLGVTIPGGNPFQSP